MANVKILANKAETQIAIQSDHCITIDGKYIKETDTPNVYRTTFDAIPANVSAVSMIAESLRKENDVELTERFVQLRQKLLLGGKLQQVLWQWNPQYQLSPSQEALAAKIVQQFQIADMNKADMHLGAGFFNCSRPGTGKTPMSIAVAMAMNARRVLVVAPNNLLTQWALEVEKFHNPMFTPAVVVIPGGTKADERQDALNQFVKFPSCWGFIGYPTLRIEVEKLKEACTQYDLIIFDECTQLINENNASAEAAWELTQQFDVKNVITMTGTPIRKHGGELWNTMRIARIPYALINNKDTFRDRHAQAKEVYIPNVGNRTIYSGIKNIVALTQGTFSQYQGLPADKTTLPAENIVEIDVFMNEDEEARYRAIEMGYSIIPGKDAVQAFSENEEMENVSVALDAHRNDDVSSLSAYLDLVAKSAHERFGIVASDDSEEDDSEPIYAEDGNESLTLDEQLAATLQEKHKLDLDVDEIKKKREELQIKVKELLLKEIVDEDLIATIQAEREELADKGRGIRAYQKDVLAPRIEGLRERIKEIKISLYQAAQQRSNTLMRLRRASSMTEWIITKDGDRKLVSADSSKIEWITQFVEDNPNDKTIVFCAFQQNVTDVVNSLKAKEVNVVALRSGMTSEESHKSVTSYMEGDAQVIVMTTGLGVGLNLQKSNNVIFHSMCFSGDVHEQNIARAIRSHATVETVNIYYLTLKFADGKHTVDGYIRNIVQNKISVAGILAASNVKLEIESAIRKSFDTDEAVRRIKEKLNL